MAASASSLAVHAEGSAKVTVDTSVFFSQHQELQRDLTVLLLQHLQATSASPKHHRILDALSGCGIRAIRYALEVPHVACVVANDVDAAAVASIKANILRNHVAQVVETSHMDAIDCMRRSNSVPFDVIDLDPFGPCASLLASAIATVASGGLVCATDTDMHTLLGKTSHAHAQCHAQYGAVPVTAAFGKELGIRIVLGAAASMASACGRYIEPVLCTAVEFFVRVHFRVHDLPRHQGRVARMSIVHQCISCAFFRLCPLGESHEHIHDDAAQDHSSKCPVCGGLLQIGGPFWAVPLQDKATIASLVATMAPATIGQSTPAFNLLRAISLEVSHDTSDLVFFISIPKLFRPFKGAVALTPSKLAFSAALTSLGYIAASTHLDPMGIKTNANMGVVYSVVVTWLHAHGCTATSPILPSVLPIPDHTSIFPTLVQHCNAEFAQPVKCILDHTWHRLAAPVVAPSPVIGQTWHVYETTFDALAAVLAQVRASDCVVLHGQRYVLPSPLHLPSEITLEGRPGANFTTLVGQVVVKSASNVALHHLHVHFPAPMDTPPPGKRPARVHPVIVAASSNICLDQCFISCGRHAPVLACLGIVDGSTGVNVLMCTIHAGPQAGICVAGKSNVVVRDCTIHDVAGCGVDIQSGSVGHLVRTRVADCGKSGVFVHSFGSLLMEECHVDRNGMAGVEVTSQANARLFQNVLSRGKKGGLLVHSSGRVEMAEDNTLTKNALAGVDVRGVGSVAVMKRNHVCNGRASGVFVSDDGVVHLHGNAIRGNKRAAIEAVGGDAIVYEADNVESNEMAGNGVPELGRIRTASEANDGYP